MRARGSRPGDGNQPPAEALLLPRCQDTTVRYPAAGVPLALRPSQNVPAWSLHWTGMSVTLVLLPCAASSVPQPFCSFVLPPFLNSAEQEHTIRHPSVTTLGGCTPSPCVVQLPHVCCSRRQLCAGFSLSGPGISGAADRPRLQRGGENTHHLFQRQNGTKLEKSRDIRKLSCLKHAHGNFQAQHQAHQAVLKTGLKKG